jgi:hypothetical protein
MPRHRTTIFGFNLKSVLVCQEIVFWFRRLAQQFHVCHPVAVRERTANVKDRTLSFGLRPEQREAVELTADYVEKAKTEQTGHTPHFLWNAKMRFGKTFTAYQLARKMGWTKVLVLTFKPAVMHAWSENLTRHIDFEGWQFITRDGELTYRGYYPKDLQERTPAGQFQARLRHKSASLKTFPKWRMPKSGPNRAKHARRPDSPPPPY